VSRCPGDGIEREQATDNAEHRTPNLGICFMIDLKPVARP